ncbi:GntR family transcriptional regulator [Variovorax sp. J22R133]|uniref:GntR family transcriptional regulator n=1 Tax=Variovorax brevis TaxID=3053503 RepID=UPI0025749923|nr:GntR family transcriptional regulator [Variovorax sp. J22R133]MDM0117776.1 GntR family transcriptional regulator [Variovorax sp. J22R133]
MKILAMSPNLSSQVHAALVAEIAQGHLKPGARIIQEQIAQRLGVSRQPVQQALLLLRDQGVLDDAPRRGLIVAPIDPDHVRNMYDIRAVIEGLAFRRAAECNAPFARRLGVALLRDGREAIGKGSATALIAADLAFHRLIHELSRNPLISPTLNTQWTCIQRVMGEVLLREESPETIWAQHEAMLDAVIAADGDAAERLAREHITHAAAIAIERLTQARRPAVVQRGRATSARHPAGFAIDHATACGVDRPLDHADAPAGTGQRS